MGGADSRGPSRLCQAFSGEQGSSGPPAAATTLGAPRVGGGGAAAASWLRLKFVRYWLITKCC